MYSRCALVAVAVAGELCGCIWCGWYTCQLSCCRSSGSKLHPTPHRAQLQRGFCVRIGLAPEHSRHRACIAAWLVARRSIARRHCSMEPTSFYYRIYKFGATYTCSGGRTHTQRLGWRKRYFLVALACDSRSYCCCAPLSHALTGLSVSDAFVATPFMGGRVAGTGPVANGMSMVRKSRRHQETLMFSCLRS